MDCTTVRFYLLNMYTFLHKRITNFGEFEIHDVNINCVYASKRGPCTLFIQYILYEFIVAVFFFFVHRFLCWSSTTRPFSLLKPPPLSLPLSLSLSIPASFSWPIFCAAFPHFFAREKKKKNCKLKTQRRNIKVINQKLELNVYCIWHYSAIRNLRMYARTHTYENVSFKKYIGQRCYFLLL